ncbi:hypothetical protein ACE1ET_19500 [Saccharicrinis sp. FJH62]|uniref:hypothetical protein n=1 Tax=Saccharicrinis sp. FJH62 TaxID=3344657 RepID=UPI0035D51920
MRKRDSIWLLVFLLLLSCEYINTSEDIQSEFILAGINSEKLDTHTYPSVQKITFENETAAGYPSTVYSGTISLDLNSDGTNDIKFYSYYGYACSMAGCFKPTKACKVLNIGNNEIEINLNPLHLRDTIDNKLDWKILGPDSDGEHKLISAILSSYTPKWTNSAEIANNIWNSGDLYLAIRIRKGDIYKYGWIRLYITDYYDLNIKETACEK